MMEITLQELTLEEEGLVTFKEAVATGIERAVKDEAGTKTMLLATASEHPDQAWLAGIYQDPAAKSAHASGRAGQAIAGAIHDAVRVATPFSLITELVAEKPAPIELDTDLQVNLVVVETTNDPENEYGRLATRAMAKAVASEPGTLAIYAGQDQQHPLRHYFLKVYRDSAAYATHIDGVWFNRVAQQTDELVVDKQIVFLDVVRLVNQGGATATPLGE